MKKGRVNGVLKGTSLDCVNIPNKLIKQLGWKINEPVQICISECFNELDNDWHEITIIRMKDIPRAYPDE